MQDRVFYCAQFQLLTACFRMQNVGADARLLPPEQLGDTNAYPKFIK